MPSFCCTIWRLWWAIWLSCRLDDDSIIHLQSFSVNRRNQPTEEHCPEKLLAQVRDAIRLKHDSCRTEQAYAGWIKRYIYFHDRCHPSKTVTLTHRGLGAPDVEANLTHLGPELATEAHSPVAPRLPDHVV
jgi:hypothetical protein